MTSYTLTNTAYFSAFAREFIRSPLDIGAISIASSSLSESMVRQVDFDKAKVIVELGSGTGVITEKIANNINSQTHCIALEMNSTLAQMTRSRCPAIKVYCDDARHIQHHLAISNHSECDAIVSGLPWSLFDLPTQESILSAIANSLAPDGSFIFYTYVGAKYLPRSRRFFSLLPSYFPSVTKSDTVWCNLPPANVYTCKRGNSNV